MRAEQKTSFHAMDSQAVMEQLKTTAEKGLSSQEVAQRVEQYGKNVIADKKQKSNLEILLEQFANPIIWILILATVLAFAYGHTLEGYAVLIVILVNTLIGFFMERQAMRSMEKLRSMARAKALVLRNGEKNAIDSVDLVPGDILFVKSGDVVTADGRIIVQNNLALKEAALTGESAHVEKSVDPVVEDTRVADQRNMIFKGTIVSRGNGIAVVVGTGPNTELGKITELAQEAKKEVTPLNKKLRSLSKKLIWLTLILATLIFVAGIARGEAWLLMVETAIALAIASIPEGLPVISTLSLARGMLGLARKNVIVKTLEAVQTLGETEVIFTDKTGTLTENEMHVQSVAFEDVTTNFSEESPAPDKLRSHEAYGMFIKVALLCNNGSFTPGNGKPESSGDPEEVALLRLAGALSEDTKAVQHRYERVAELPFDAQIKMMATVNRVDDQYMVCVKGAAEEVLQQCTQVMEGDAIKDLADPDGWKRKANEMADQGLRVLGFAYRLAKENPGKENIIHDLVFIGLAGFIDPARPDVRQAIMDCRKAGIKVVMVTGDHPGTANAIAREVGLAGDEEIINIHGRELQENAGEEQVERALNATVFSRVDPAQKLNLVTIYQKRKIVIGMTGDGVNDAPALKKADIGIAMGIRGTEAAKEAADMILNDDAFTSIVTAVKYGRVIFDNIRAFVIYLLSCNLSEILIVAVAAFANMPMPLLPLQILFLNMITDVFPALAIGMSKGEEEVVMDRPPKKSTEPIVSRSNWVSIVSYAICLTAGVIGAELYVLSMPGVTPAAVNNVTFYTLILAQLWNVFNMSPREVPFLNNQITRNRYIWYALIFCIAVTVLMNFIPSLRTALSLVDFNTDVLAIIIAASILPVVLVQLLKRALKIIR